MGKVMTPSEIVAAAEHLRAEGATIVFTNGCFDILHAGHVRYLGAARALGDVLIVGLNSDRSVGTLKKGRPINHESERAEVLASLEMVDFVVIFDEDTPLELIRSIAPDVLVKGGDWKKEDIVGAELVGEVHSLPYHGGFSTSGIIDRILAIGKGS
ncbi:MAG: D-glycero-beta-D-manno-heptose 1-phosphate adenylyltransferase [Thermodesulfovibrionales bacterium]